MESPGVRQDTLQSSSAKIQCGLASSQASWSLSFLICEMGIFIFLSQEFCENQNCYMVSDPQRVLLKWCH